jgi:hypothetical protein
MNETTYGTCPTHGTKVMIISQHQADKMGIEHGCPDHNEELHSRPPVSAMTADEKVAELRGMDGPLYHGLNLLFGRMDDLVGRPLFTRERTDFDVLEYEIRSGQSPTLEGVLAKFPDDKPVVELWQEKI